MIFLKKVFLKMVRLQKMPLNLLALGLLVSSCRTDTAVETPEDLSAPKALSSNDWLKKGVDRFYLAWMQTDSFIAPGHKELYGQQFFFGIGCYGEDKDGFKSVSVRKAPGSTEMITKKLNERSMLHEFDIVPEKSTAKPGQCKVLLGDETVAQQISNLDSMTSGGKKGAVGMVYASASFICFGSLVQTTKFIGMAGAGFFASTASAGGATPVVIPPLLVDGVATAAAIVGCGAAIGGSVDGRLNYMKDENKKLFATSLLEASKLASETLKSDKILLARYNQVRRSFSTIDVAAAIWNPIFVKEFNLNINKTFENGWFSNEKFFNGVRSVQTETLNSGTTAR